MAVPLTAEQANAVYDVLVEHCGASGHPDEKTNFVFHQTCKVEREYRFQGRLGLGGKFYRDGSRDQWRVGCYREDLTPERQAMIGAANAALAELKEAA